jgi:hypothetical protein
MDADDSQEVTEVGGYTISPETIEHFRAMCALLDENERQVLSSFVARSPKELVARAEQRLMALTPRCWESILGGYGLGWGTVASMRPCYVHVASVHHRPLPDELGTASAKRTRIGASCTRWGGVSP